MYWVILFSIVWVIQVTTSSRFYRYAFVEFLDDISLHFLFGVLLAGLIAALVPEGFFEAHGIGRGIGGMALMILVGIPMYICATSSIPVAAALMAAGVSPGAAFVFLAVGPLTNAATLSVLYKTLKGRVLAVYIASGIITALTFGALLDIIFDGLPGPVTLLSEQSPAGIRTGVALLFLALLLISLFRVIRLKTSRRAAGRQQGG